MGYCDLNFIVELKLKDGTPYLAEVQVNHVAMLEAKSEAHTHYEVVRKRLTKQWVISSLWTLHLK